jgi:hypothetical protein
MKSYLVFIALLLLTVYYGCKDTVTNEDIDKVIIPDNNISYMKYIQPVFDIKCNNSACHSDETRAADLSLTSYQNATADLSFIFPGQPQNSRLVISIQGSSAFPMPPVGYPPLTKNQINGIITWVKEGAKNN